MKKIQFLKMEPEATIPKRATDGSAGFDLYAVEDKVIAPGCSTLVPTGISCAIPHGCAGFIWPRSGLAKKKGVQVLGGLIDSDYRDEIIVMLTCFDPFKVEVGDRIAQLVISHYLKESIEVQELDDPLTREGGFGSTGD